MTDIYTDEALQARFYELWYKGYQLGVIIALLHLDLEPTYEWMHYQGLI